MSHAMSKILVLSMAVTLPFVVVPARANAQAVTDTTNISEPIDILVFVPCANAGAGELVLLSGELHVLLHTTFNDNSVTIKEHFQPQGISGTGFTTGDKYEGTGVTQQTATFQTDGAPFEQTFINNFRIVGQGPDNNFLVHQTFHLTFNNNGELTAFQDNFSVDCK
jgi:hypothetical protein